MCENKGLQLYGQFFLSSPATEYKINCCGIMRPNRKNCPKRLPKMQNGDLSVRCGMCWKDKREVFLLSHMHHSDMKRTTLRDDVHNTQMGDRMINSGS
ncbi:hypothetical protein NPIL_263411 [Nephila pilipes]|uniref:Uncharacterized protein n=1 Tax=Nephila pilipes TaxID=299642 RepID=A0A8X6UAJ7_NEPPI|nr:hypothetical protein NPIL_263411 [Nephila pilipes]